MSETNCDWKLALADMFGGAINQEPLEEAAEFMVSISAANAIYHMESLEALENGIIAAKNGEASVIDCINKSAYHVSTIEQAVELLMAFKKLYMAEYKRVVERPGR